MTADYYVRNALENQIPILRILPIRSPACLSWIFRQRALANVDVGTVIENIYTLRATIQIATESYGPDDLDVIFRDTLSEKRPFCGAREIQGNLLRRVVLQRCLIEVREIQVPRKLSSAVGSAVSLSYCIGRYSDTRTVCSVNQKIVGNGTYAALATLAYQFWILVKTSSWEQYSPYSSAPI